MSLNSRKNVAPRSVIRREGYMVKVKSGMTKSSARRWFVLDDLTLTYYTSSGAQGEPLKRWLAWIDIKNIAQVTNLNPGIQFLARVVNFPSRKPKINRTFQLQCETRDAELAWFADLSGQPPAANLNSAAGVASQSPQQPAISTVSTATSPPSYPVPTIFQVQELERQAAEARRRAEEQENNARELQKQLLETNELSSVLMDRLRAFDSGVKERDSAIEERDRLIAERDGMIKELYLQSNNGDMAQNHAGGGEVLQEKDRIINSLKLQIAELASVGPRQPINQNMSEKVQLENEVLTLRQILDQRDRDISVLQSRLEEAKNAANSAAEAAAIAASAAQQAVAEKEQLLHISNASSSTISESGPPRPTISEEAFEFAQRQIQDQASEIAELKQRLASQQRDRLSIAEKTEDFLILEEENQQLKASVIKSRMELAEVAEVAAQRIKQTEAEIEELQDRLARLTRRNGTESPSNSEYTAANYNNNNKNRSKPEELKRIGLNFEAINDVAMV